MKHSVRRTSTCSFVASNTLAGQLKRSVKRFEICRLEFFGQRTRRQRCIATPQRYPILTNIDSEKKEMPRKEPKHDWNALIDEFEQRAAATEYSSSPPPPGVKLTNEVNENFELRPLVEIAAMSAVTFALWYIGRYLRLDSFLRMFYPLPMFIIAMRWGPKRGDEVLYTTLALVLTLMGPLFSVLYLLNTGIMAMVLSRALWHQWPCLPTIIACGLAKGVGLSMQFTLMSPILRENSWQFVTTQVKLLVDVVLSGVYALLRRPTVPELSIAQVQYAVVVILVLHSVLQVFFTYLSSTMIVDHIGESTPLKRKVRLWSLLQLLKDRVRENSTKQL